MQDISTKVDGVSTLPAAEFNQIPSELENAITDTGQTLASGTLDQVSKAMSTYAAGGDFYTDSGAADAYVLSVIGSKKAPTAYFNGMTVRFLPGNANTGASTINVATLGSKNIKLADGSTDPLSGDIAASSEIQLTYDGTNFRITSRATVTGTSVVTTRGDIITGNAAGNEQRLGIGAADAYVGSDGTDVVWKAATDMLALVYPIGSYYFNETNSTNPSTLLGFGTWVAVTDTFVVGHGGVYTATGGAATVSLSSGNNGPHTHTVTGGATVSSPSTNTLENATDASANGSVTTGSSGSGTAFSIIPPYQAVYIWKRTV